MPDETKIREFMRADEWAPRPGDWPVRLYFIG
jgi:hypothetical protein